MVAAWACLSLSWWSCNWTICSYFVRAQISTRRWKQLLWVFNGILLLGCIWRRARDKASPSSDGPWLHFHRHLLSSYHLLWSWASWSSNMWKTKCSHSLLVSLQSFNAISCGFNACSFIRWSWKTCSSFCWPRICEFFIGLNTWNHRVLVIIILLPSM